PGSWRVGPRGAPPRVPPPPLRRAAPRLAAARPLPLAAPPLASAPPLPLAAPPVALVEPPLAPGAVPPLPPVDVVFPLLPPVAAPLPLLPVAGSFSAEQPTAAISVASASAETPRVTVMDRLSCNGWWFLRGPKATPRPDDADDAAV